MISTFAISHIRTCSNHPILSILRLFRVNRAICVTVMFLNLYNTHYGDKAVQKTPLSNALLYF